MTSKKVRAIDILRLIPYEELSKLSVDTKVDYYAKTLSGERVFYLLVYAFLAADQVSQRKLETVFNTDIFKTLFNISLGEKITHGSISTRLKKINVDFFEKAYDIIYKRFTELYPYEEALPYNLIRVDSSMVAETSNKLYKGFTVGKKPTDGKSARNQIKYTMAYDGFAAKLAKVFSDATYLSEDMAMPEVLMELIKKDINHENIYVLDRGFSSVKNYNDVTAKNAKFIGRIKTNRKMTLVKNLMNEDIITDLGKLVLEGDEIVLLNDKTSTMPVEYRVVKTRFKVPRDTTRRENKGKTKKVENKIYFITNDFELTPQQIADSYGRRWDIEVFFKFLKQNLSFSHFISTNENGIKVILYMTLITAMLIMIYKRENNMGYTIGKFSLFMEMQDWIVKLMAILNNEELNSLAYKDMKIRAGNPEFR